MLVTAVSAASQAHAALFTAASSGSTNAKLTATIDDCGNVPHWPGHGNPPPPPPVENLERAVIVNLATPKFDEDGGWCGTVPHKLPFPPPPPPWVDGINAMLGSR